VWRICALSPTVRNVVATPAGSPAPHLTQLLDFEYALGIWDRMELDFLMDAIEMVPTSSTSRQQGFYSLYVAGGRPAARILAFRTGRLQPGQLRRNVAGEPVETSRLARMRSPTRRGQDLLSDQARNRGASSMILTDAVTARRRQRMSRCPASPSWRPCGARSRRSASQDRVEGYEYPVLRKFFDRRAREPPSEAIVVEVVGNRFAAIGGARSICSSPRDTGS